MKTTELLEIEQSLRLLEHVLARGGDEGEHLVPCSGRDGEGSLARQRLATRKTLSAAKNLLTVSLRLMDEPTQLSSKEVTLEMKAAIEKLKVAARGAYEAGHLLVGVKKRAA